MYDYGKLLKSLNIVAIITIILFIFANTFDSVFQLADGKPFTDYGSMFASIALMVFFSFPYTFYLQCKPQQEEYITTITLVLNSFAILFTIFTIWVLITEPGDHFSKSLKGIVILFTMTVAILNIFSLLKKEK